MSKTPEFWMEDYTNEWLGVRLYLDCWERGKKKEIGEIKNFEDYVAGRQYGGYQCNIKEIPKEFITFSTRASNILNRAIKRGDYLKARKIYNLTIKGLFGEDGRRVA